MAALPDPASAPQVRTGLRAPAIIGALASVAFVAGIMTRAQMTPIKARCAPASSRFSHPGARCRPGGASS